MMRATVIASEDARFCTHRGVDLQEILDAIEDADDLSEARGGSTITQQTAKNLLLRGGRSTCARRSKCRWRFGSTSCCRNVACSKSISTSRNRGRTASFEANINHSVKFLSSKLADAFIDE